METIPKAPTKSASPSWKPTITMASVIWRGMIIWLLIALVILCRILYPGFWRATTSSTFSMSNVQVGLIALGMTFVMIAGCFYLSAGAIYAAGGRDRTGTVNCKSESDGTSARRPAGPDGWVDLEARRRVGPLHST